MKDYNYRWTLKDANFTKDKGKVFSCFACGGGSTMGYKLAGFDVIGCNDNDPAMMKIYKANHNPKFPFLDLIQDFKDQKELPKELFDLDILDGSPPCSSFSMSGNREKDWGKDKKFREGQAKQVLDELFFDFIDLAERLQPKVVVAENVKGLIMGEAKTYVARIRKAFSEAGYYVDLQLLNSKDMGVPQRRERVFFCAIRKDLYTGPLNLLLDYPSPELVLSFQNNPVIFGEYRSAKGSQKGMSPTRTGLLEYRDPKDKCISNINERLWDDQHRKVKAPDMFGGGADDGTPRILGAPIINSRVSGFNALLIGDDEVYPTVTSGERNYRKFDGLGCTRDDYVLTGSFPMDYDFGDAEPKYVIGMSVPPLMVAHVADAIYEQWLKDLK